MRGGLQGKWTIPDCPLAQLSLTFYTPAFIKCNRTHAMAFETFINETSRLSPTPLKTDQDL